MRSNIALAILAMSLAPSIQVFALPQASKSFTRQNGIDAIELNQNFATLTPNSTCQAGTDACVSQKFAQCVNGEYVLTACAPGTICAALPLVNSPGTSITCTTEADLDSRIAATGASNTTTAASPTVASTITVATASASAVSSNNCTAGANLQSSFSLDPSLVQTGFQSDGQETPEAGQVPSLTSSNNYINFCATVPNLPLTGGQQLVGGSCNAAPMGIIASKNNMPSSKFISPKNLDVLKANTPFTISMAINHITTGLFVNPDTNYYSAPQQVDVNGDIKGHSHVVIEELTSLTQTSPTDPTKFAFFKGVNGVAQNGVLTANVTSGLPIGFYKLSSMNAAANHQPVLVAVAQHGSLDDQIYFTVTADGGANTSSTVTGAA